VHLSGRRAFRPVPHGGNSWEPLMHERPLASEAGVHGRARSRSESNAFITAPMTASTISKVAPLRLATLLCQRLRDYVMAGKEYPFRAAARESSPRPSARKGDWLENSWLPDSSLEAANPSGRNDQAPKFFAANSQFTKLQNASTYFGRRLR